MIDVGNGEYNSSAATSQSIASFGVQDGYSGNSKMQAAQQKVLQTKDLMQ
jgi:hypothetical protein